MGKFKKTLDLAGGGYLECVFNYMFTVNGPRWFITVTDFNKGVYRMFMGMADDTWMIIDKNDLPGWIVVLENTFGNYIKEHTALQKN
jgi:hypothetical protein